MKQIYTGDSVAYNLVNFLYEIPIYSNITKEKNDNSDHHNTIEYLISLELNDHQFVN